MDVVDEVQDIAQQIAAVHAVRQAAEHGRDNVAPVAATVAAAQAAQVSEQSRAAPAARQGGFLADDKADQVGARNAVRRGGPIAPAVGRLDGLAECLAGHRRLVLVDRFEIIQEFQE